MKGNKNASALRSMAVAKLIQDEGKPYDCILLAARLGTTRQTARRYLRELKCQPQAGVKVVKMGNKTVAYPIAEAGK